jgi:hypothetical protein
MHDWQVPLVPTYAEMTPAVAARIGKSLMEIQDVNELRGLMELSRFDNSKPKEVAEPIQVTVADHVEEDPDPFSFYLSLDGKRLNVDAFDDILSKSDVKSTIGSVDIKLVLKSVGGASAQFLVYGMGLSPEQFVVILASAYETMGHDVFIRILGIPGERELVVKLAQYALSQKINGKSPLSDCSFFIKNFVSQAFKKHTTKDLP